MSTYLNPTNMPLSLAVFFATDDYDYEPDTVSATKLMRPLRQLVLTPRIPAERNRIELSSRVKSRIGQSLHKGIEEAWLRNKDYAMRALGYPQHIIDRVKVNPNPATLQPGDIPVYLEQRSYRQLGKYKVSGKPDFIADGRVEDFKSTSTYTWVNDTKTDDYQLQGSIYRWIDPVRITKDEIAINFIFTDWSPAWVDPNTNYPPAATAQKLIPLMSLQETEAWIHRKLSLIEDYNEAPEKEIPLCTDTELWRKDPVWKYYKNPASRKRSTKNFDNSIAAYNYMANEGGGQGIVIEQPGLAVACKYCPAFEACSQKDDLLARGELKI